MNAYFDKDEHFHSVVAKDVAALVLGDCLGYGETRAIYEHALDKSLVVKVENGATNFCNISEWQIWQAVKDTEFAKWFAPVVSIGPAGSVLTMRKCEPARREELPDKVPAFFTDLKPENFGRLDGRIVCLDYGYHRFFEFGMTKRLRKADWDE